MKISISIMCHPSRVRYVGYLRDAIGRADIPVAMDEKSNIWDTCRRAWLLFDPTADYHLVIQDDALIGKDLLANLERYLTEDAVYNLYIGRPRFEKEVREARESGADRLVKHNIHHEMALILPTHRVLEMVNFCDAIETQDDKKINQYVRANDLKVIFPMPSLVDHRNEGSLHNMNKGSYKAVANWFIGE